MGKPSSAITRDMPIQDIVTFLPQAKSALAEYGLHCFSCAGSEFETLEQGCLGHGFSQEEVSELVDDLNVMLAEMPERPQTLIVTGAAARAIRGIAKDEGRLDEGLAVIADAAGGFCMEFRSEAEDGEKIFTNAEEPSVEIFASPLTLKRIGGATIDFRDGRFKLDLPEDDAAPACSCKGGDGRCHCADKTVENGQRTMDRFVK